jgi:hypothetical protein
MAVHICSPTCAVGVGRRISVPGWLQATVLDPKLKNKARSAGDAAQV